MITRLLSTALLMALLATMAVRSVAADGNRPQHFEGQKFETWQQAQTALNLANQELKALTEQPELSIQESVKIHQLSYTMENALQFMRKQIVETELILEELHLSSESPNLEQTRKLAEQYLGKAKNWTKRAR